MRFGRPDNKIYCRVARTGPLRRHHRPGFPPARPLPLPLGLLLTVLQSSLTTIRSYLTAYIGKLLTFDSEARIFSRIRELLPRATVISATHRLGSLKNADRILVLKAGRLVEEGSHRELIERQGFYRTLFKAESE